MSALAALLLGTSLAAAPDPYAPARAEMGGQGWSLVERAERAAGPIELSAFVWSRGGRSALRVYAARKGRAYLLYLHPESRETLRLEGGWRADLFGDKAAGLLYRSQDAALGRDALNVLRFDRPRVRRVGRFPEGRLRDVDGDGRPEIVAARRPLGARVLVGCESFSALAAGVQALEVHAWRRGAFADASASHPRFFAQAASRAERAALDAGPDHGARAAHALNAYFAHAARGEGKAGWRRLGELLEPAGRDGRAADCLGQLKSDLRRRLKIPEDWPADQEP